MVSVVFRFSGLIIQNGYASANAAELASFIYAYMYDKEALKDASFGQSKTDTSD